MTRVLGRLSKDIELTCPQRALAAITLVLLLLLSFHQILPAQAKGEELYWNNFLNLDFQNRKIRILIDLSHWGLSMGAFSDVDYFVVKPLEEIIREEGMYELVYVAPEAQLSSALENLENVNILILPGIHPLLYYELRRCIAASLPYCSEEKLQYSFDEVHSIKEFVYKGGGLLMIFGIGMHDSLKYISDMFGITEVSYVIADTSFNNIVREHPVTYNVDTVTPSDIAGCSGVLYVNSLSARSLIFVDSDTRVAPIHCGYKYQNSHLVSYGCSVIGWYESVYERKSYSYLSLLAVAQYGKGRVVGISECLWHSGNSKLIRNVLRWLAGLSAEDSAQLPTTPSPPPESSPSPSSPPLSYIEILIIIVAFLVAYIIAHEYTIWRRKQLVKVIAPVATVPVATVSEEDKLPSPPSILSVG